MRKKNGNCLRRVFTATLLVSIRMGNVHKCIDTPKYYKDMLYNNPKTLKMWNAYSTPLFFRRVKLYGRFLGLQESSGIGRVIIS